MSAQRPQRPHNLNCHQNAKCLYEVDLPILQFNVTIYSGVPFAREFMSHQFINYHWVANIANSVIWLQHLCIASSKVHVYLHPNDLQMRTLLSKKPKPTSWGKSLSPSQSTECLISLIAFDCGKCRSKWYSPPIDGIVCRIADEMSHCPGGETGRRTGISFAWGTKQVNSRSFEWQSQNMLAVSELWWIDV